MHIKDLAIDRYGAWSNLRLSELDERLNVIYGVNGSGKTTVVRFLQAMLYGFPHFQESAAPAQSSPWGGTITVEGPQGCCVIRRHDNGTRTGRLTLHTVEGAPIDRDVLPELLSGIDESMFRLLFIASFRDAPPTETLVQTALAHGFDLAEAPPARSPRLDEVERIRRLEEDRREAARLQDRRRAVEVEIEDMERDRVHLRHRREDELRRVQDEIDRCEAEALRLRRERKTLDEELAAWEERRTPPSSLAAVAPLADVPRDIAVLQRRLRAVESQQKRWQRVQHDVVSRRTRLRREMMSWAADGSASPVTLWDDAQKHIDGIERRLEQLQDEVRALAQTPVNQTCNCREADVRCTPLVRATRDEVYHLCRELNRHYLDNRRDAITEELNQLRRCHREVGLQLRRLAKRKEQIERALELHEAAIAPLRARRQDVAEALRRVERELADRHEERRRVESVVIASHEERIAARRRELEAIQRDLDDRLARLAAYDWSDALVRRLRDAEPQPPQATMTQEASDHLRRLTGGQFVRIHVRRNERPVWVEDARGELFSLESQGRSVRDRTHLALCVALVGAYARRGVRLPLILDDAFINLDAPQIDQAAELLREFAARGHQVFVFTCREQVARVFRRLDAPVLELPRESSLHEQFALRWGAEPVSLTHSPAAPSVSNDLLPPLGDDRGRSWPDRDGVRQPRHFLQRSDAIHYAPDIDKPVAGELAGLGVATVGEFLAMTPHALEARLSHLRVPLEAIRRWQATARLMCDTPYLRAYDARILVASGVTSVEDLERLSAEELLQRVERCLDTEEGRRLFSMGDDEELARLASWIGSGRATQTLRETQKRHWSRRRRGERSRPWYDETPAPVALHDHRRTRRRFHLEASSPVLVAPSISPFLAEQLRAIGVKTVADLLAVSPESAARRIGHARITAQTIREWQAQASLVCTVPELRSHESQILVACGVTTADQLAACRPDELFQLVEPFTLSREGQALLREARRPDRKEVADWIACARHARQLHAA